METKNCLILAAGLGSRIADLAKSKPLLEVSGKPLIQHVIESASKAGMENFFVVSGYNGNLVRSFLDFYAEKTHTNITHVINEDWESPNGVSVRSAQSVIDGAFCLLMSDHLFDSSILKDLNQLSVGEQDIILAVDDNMKNKFVSLDDVTRVKVDNDKIVAIGKDIDDYNAYDTGIFKCSPHLFDALKQAGIEGDQSLSGGIRYLAKTGNARCFNIGNRVWVDVDDPAVLNLVNEHYPF